MVLRRPLAFVCLAFVSLAAGCGGSTPHVDCPNGHVNFGVEPYVTGPRFAAAYKSFVAELSKKFGCPVKLVIAPRYTAEISAMREHKLDMAEFGAVGYVFAHRLANAEPVATFADTHGEPDAYSAGVWVKKDSPIMSLDDLRGRTLALADPGSTSGAMYPLYALKSHGISAGDVNIKYAGGHPEALLALTSGAADAAELNSRHEADAVSAKTFNPSGYRQIWRSAPIPNDPITVRGDLPAKFREAVKSALLKLSVNQLASVENEAGVSSAPLLPADDSAYRELGTVLDANHLRLSSLDG